MKKVLCVILALGLFCLSLAGLAEVTGPSYIGTWVCGRATIEISDEHPGYRVLINWGGSAWEVATWEYHCPYELQDGKLVSEPTGTQIDLTFGEGGEQTDSVTHYEDGAAVFSIDEKGLLHWDDKKDNAGADMDFEKTGFYGLAPEAEEFEISYFKMIADPELTLDKKATEALNFAAASELWLADGAALRENMLAAWEGLTGEEQSAFDASFLDVAKLLDACFEDWSANRATFTDGRDERMDELLAEPLYREAWQTLCGNTLTLGNSD